MTLIAADLGTLRVAGIPDQFVDDLTVTIYRHTATSKVHVSSLCKVGTPAHNVRLGDIPEAQWCRRCTNDRSLYPNALNKLMSLYDKYICRIREVEDQLHGNRNWIRVVGGRPPYGSQALAAAHLSDELRDLGDQVVTKFGNLDERLAVYLREELQPTLARLATEVAADTVCVDKVSRREAAARVSALAVAIPGQVTCRDLTHEPNGPYPYATDYPALCGPDQPFGQDAVIKTVWTAFAETYEAGASVQAAAQQARTEARNQLARTKLATPALWDQLPDQPAPDVTTGTPKERLLETWRRQVSADLDAIITRFVDDVTKHREQLARAPRLLVYTEPRGSLLLGDFILNGYQAGTDTGLDAQRGFVTLPEGWDDGLAEGAIANVKAGFRLTDADPADIATMANQLATEHNYSPSQAVAAVRLAHR